MDAPSTVLAVLVVAGALACGGGGYALGRRGKRLVFNTQVQAQESYLAEERRSLRETEGTLRRVLAERDEEVSYLKRLLSKDFRGELVIRIIKHRGKGGTKPETEQTLPIQGQSTAFRQQLHVGDDIYDILAEVKLGA